MANIAQRLKGRRREGYVFLVIEEATPWNERKIIGMRATFKHKKFDMCTKEGG